MKAYLVEEFGKPLVERELDDPKPAGKEVLVGVRYTGLCHSDLHFHDGYFQLGGEHRLPVTEIGIQLPHALGHEIYGEIEDFGPDAGLSEADRGKRVIVYPWLGCGDCEACNSGRDNMCATPHQIGVNSPGGHAEKIIVREPKFLVDAEGIDPVLAGLYACSGLTSHSALKKLGPLHDRWIAIVGLGGVGMMALAVAKGTGFEKVAVVDIDDAKLRTAVDEYGADRAFNGKADGIADQIKAETGGGVAGAIDFVGSDESVGLGTGVLAPTGVYVSVGLFGGALHFPLVPLAVMQFVFRGSFVGTLSELEELVGHVRQGKIKAIPTTTVPFTQVNESVERLRAGKVIGRVVFQHA